MKRNKYIALTLMLSLLCMSKTYASCTQQEKEEFEKIKNKYSVTYEFNTDTKMYDFTIKREMPNMYDYKMHIVGVNEEPNEGYNLECKEQDDKVIKCINYPSGQYYFTIVGQTDTCTDVFKEEILDIPQYNKFYDDPLCEGIEEFVLCQPTYSKKLDYETFVSRVNTYKKTKLEKEEEAEKGTASSHKQNEQIENIKDYLKNNLLQVSIMVAFIILLTISIIVTINSIKKSRRLE